MKRGQNGVRITSDENVVTNAKIEVLTGEDAEGNEIWSDVSKYVQGVDSHLHVGEVSRVNLKLILVSAYISGRLDDETLHGFAWMLRENGWETKSPDGGSAHHLAQHEALLQLEETVREAHPEHDDPQRTSWRCDVCRAIDRLDRIRSGV